MNTTKNIRFVELHLEGAIHRSNIFLKGADPQTPDAHSHVADMVDLKEALEKLLKRH